MLASLRFSSSPSPSALRQPLWWSALVLLVLNDHLLKGSDLLPGAVTGKLSDFVGLIVAPALAATVLRAHSQKARFVAFALVVAPFVAINLSPAAARLVEQLTAVAGFPWRIWTDPTDLLGLAVLPITWRLCEHDRATRRHDVSPLARAGVVLGGLACIATSPPPPEPLPWTTESFAVNRTGGVIDLRVRWLEAEVDCLAVAEDPARALSPEVFGEGITVQLEPNMVMPFDRAAAQQAVGASVDEPEVARTCDAVLVQADGLAPTIAFWDGLGTGPVLPELEPSETRGGQVGIHRDTGALLRVEAPRGDVSLARAEERVGPSGCTVDAASSFEWSFAGLPHLGSYVLASIFHNPDGCLLLELEDVLDATVHRGHLCMPGVELPFAEGDHLHVTVSGLDLEIAREREDGTFGDSLKIVQMGRSLHVGPTGGLLEALECGGERTLCGAYVQTASLVIDGLEPIYPGEARDLGPAEGYANVRMILGRAEHVAVTRADCEPARSQVGERGSVVFHYQEVRE